MTTIRMQGSDNQNFKQIEGDTWLSTYLPAICAVALMGGALFLAISCSKKSDNVAKISAATQPAVSSPVPSTPAATVAEAKKVVKKHRPTNATYVNSAYGVSFSYPRKYSLQSGDKLGTAPVRTTFLKPGAVQVATVDMPDDSYPETDFSSAVFNVSVNHDMISDECMQFVQAPKDGREAKPTTVKLGTNEYSVFEQISGEGARKSDLKYFHLFKNNACYEFALDVDTTDRPDSDLASVDRGKVFQQLEKILKTARIKDLQPTDAETATKALAGGDKAAEVQTAVETKAADPKATDVKTTSKSENAQVVTPEHK